MWIEALIVIASQGIIALALLSLKDKFLAQKLLHLTIGVSTLMLYNILPFEIFFSLSLLATAFLALMPGKIFHKKFGVVAYPLSVSLAAFFFYDNNFVFTYSLYPMFFADPLGAIVGRYFGRNRIPCGKTLEGTAVVYGINFLIFLTGGFSLVDSAFISFILTLLEISSPGGLDNVTVPLSAMAILGGWGYMELWISLPISLVVALMITLAGWLTLCASLAAASLGTIILYAGGLMWVIPLIVFVGLASIAGRFFGSDEKIRNVNQVFANGGVSAFLAILYSIMHLDVLFYMHLSAVAAMMSDTLATEVGMKFSRYSYLITSFKPVSKGTSGGVSGWGFVGALVGALIISVFAMDKFLPVALSGFVGSLIDSYLGALFERRGLWNNDVTNFLSAAFGSLFFLMVFGGWFL